MERLFKKGDRLWFTWEEKNYYRERDPECWALKSRKSVAHPVTRRVEATFIKYMGRHQALVEILVAGKPKVERQCWLRQLAPESDQSTACGT